MNKEDYGECEGRKIRIDDDYREEGTCGIDRVRCERLPWYHNTNRIIDQYDKIDDDEIDDKSLCCIKTATKKNKNKNKECFEIKFGDYYEGDFPINEPKVNDRQDTKTIDSSSKFRYEEYTDIDGKPETQEEQIDWVKRYLRDNVIDGRSGRGKYCVTDKSKSIFKRGEIDEYRNDQIEFRNKIMNTSDPAVDPVDKMNMLTLAGGIKGTGIGIADVYDNLVNTRDGQYGDEPGFESNFGYTHNM